MKNINISFAKGKHVQLDELETKFHLSFSSYLVLASQLIALDGLKNSLLVWEASKDLDQSYVIELNKVAAVSVKKSYGGIRPEDLYVSGSEDFLKRIDLQFEYSNKKAILLPFYDCNTDKIRDLPRLERSARDWQLILSKLVGSQANRISSEKNKPLLPVSESH